LAALPPIADPEGGDDFENDGGLANERLDATPRKPLGGDWNGTAKFTVYRPHSLPRA
jgi:hypothetical protein